MSIDINWETLTGGDDGAALAEAIRSFVHDRFQRVTLPRMIRSVNVHSFEFGDIAPSIEVKDVCDPLPDFYDDTDEEDDDIDHAHDTPDESPEERHNAQRSETSSVNIRKNAKPHGCGNAQPDEYHGNSSSDFLGRQSHTSDSTTLPPRTRMTNNSGQGHFPQLDHLTSSAFSRSGTPGLLGGTSNLGYFHLPLSAGLSGTSTPLAAVAGAQFQHAWPNQNGTSSSSHNRSTSFGSVTPPSITTPSSRPVSRHHDDWPSPHDGSDSPRMSQHTAERERSTEDLQVVSHIKYSGNIRLSLTAEILLDYPMPSFVGIPLKLNITGLTFDGIAIVAYIKKKAHFCFLGPDDAEALVGGGTNLAMSSDEDHRQVMSDNPGKIGGLLEEIKVDSEIGNQENGKQVLKNVGKIERFILEQVRRIFEDEFVYPSFWTFLV